MAARLLFDENLSRHLVRRLADLFPGSVHVTDLALDHSSDTLIWERAKSDGLVVVSRDSDFGQRSSVVGFPPKVIWLRLGNRRTARVEYALRTSADRIEAFLADDEEALLVIEG